MLLSFKTEGRKLMEELSEGYRLREAAGHNKALFRAEKHGIAPQNSYF
jgi:hypothetical protein